MENCHRVYNSRSPFWIPPMQTVSVNLPDDLAAFIGRALADGAFDSIDHLFAHAIGLVRTEAMLGAVGMVHTAEPPPVSKSETLVPPVDLTRQGIDLTRQGFDTPAFMADLVGKIKNRDDVKPLKNS